jgi:hypothetical protein
VGAPFRKKKSKSFYPNAHRGTEYNEVRGDAGFTVNAYTAQYTVYSEQKTAILLVKLKKVKNVFSACNKISLSFRYVFILCAVCI